MTVAVMFAVQYGSGVQLAEAELDAVRTVDPKLLDGLDPLYGRYVLVATGQPFVALHDDLEDLTMNLLVAIPALAQGEEVPIAFSSAPTMFTMTPDGDTIRITGDLPAPLAVPAAELLPAIHECASRFLAFVRATLAHQPGFAERLPALEEAAAQAAAAL